MGINRLSVGIQSFLEEELKWMNRVHTVAESLFCIDKIKEAQDELKKLPLDDFTNASALFKSAKDLHNAYYVSLIEQLSITGKILDADGD